MIYVMYSYANEMTAQCDNVTIINVHKKEMDIKRYCLCAIFIHIIVCCVE